MKEISIIMEIEIEIFSSGLFCFFNLNSVNCNSLIINTVIMIFRN